MSREVDIMLMHPMKAVEDEVSIRLDAHHIVQRLLVEILDHKQKLVPNGDPLAQFRQIYADRLPLSDCLFVDALIYHFLTASHL